MISIWLLSWRLLVGGGDGRWRRVLVGGGCWGAFFLQSRELLIRSDLFISVLLFYYTA